MHVALLNMHCLQITSTYSTGQYFLLVEALSSGQRMNNFLLNNSKFRKRKCLIHIMDMLIISFKTVCSVSAPSLLDVPAASLQVASSSTCFCCVGWLNLTNPNPNPNPCPELNISKCRFILSQTSLTAPTLSSKQSESLVVTSCWMGLCVSKMLM